MNENTRPTVLSVLVRDWRSIAVASLAVAVAVLAISFVVRNKYTASVVLLPPREESGLGELLTGLAASPALSRAFGFSSSSGTELYLGVLRSRTVADEIIQRFDLVKVYHVKDVEKAERKLKDRTAITTSNEEFVRIDVKDESRQRSADLANAYVASLDRFLQQNTNTSARLRREFLEARLKESQDSLRSAEDRLRDFQVHSNLPMTSPDAAVEALGSLMEKKTSLEVELGLLRSISRESVPRMAELQAQLGQIERELDRIPPAATVGVRLARAVKIQERIVLLLTEEREQARLAELRNIPTVEVVDHARAPIRKSEPRRLLLTAGALVVAFFANLWLAWARAARRAESPEPAGP